MKRLDHQILQLLPQFEINEMGPLENLSFHEVWPVLFLSWIEDITLDNKSFCF
jgi:hypothetical protein